MVSKNDSEARTEYTLSELNGRIKGVIYEAFPSACWVRAEISDVRTNSMSGHCYLEFIEKDPVRGTLIAKARGSIWAKTFRMIKPYFEQTTGQSFVSGLKVLVKVSIEFHELYGYSLTVVDIDPTYTLGDLMRKRLEIIQRLKDEGVFSLNKELPFPLLPKRIAVITSATAAGYEDFMNQLLHNGAGYAFSVDLFAAVMQGDKTETSVIAALERVYENVDRYDVVVIIRGGGATSDLNSFDSYLLAAHCAQFPLPIITGIGHERDDTILDLVANVRMKTPTAVAEFLVGSMDTLATTLEDLQQRILQSVSTLLVSEKSKLQLIAHRLPGVAMSSISRNRSLLERASAQLPLQANSVIAKSRSVLERAIGQLPMQASSMLHYKKQEIEIMQQQLSKETVAFLLEKGKSLELAEQFIKMASPEYILQRGYTLTISNGKIVKDPSTLIVGSHITTRFAKGDVVSIVYRK